jgi:hypothetical protein
MDEKQLEAVLASLNPSCGIAVKESSGWALAVSYVHKRHDDSLAKD